MKQDEWRVTHKAVPCNCGHPTCKDWHVSPCADVHGVSFSENEARLVAAFLNALDHKDEG